MAISSKLIADLLTTAGANRALFMDLHAAQIQGFFNIPVDHMFASPVMVSYFRELNLPNLTVVSPDAGGVERARFFATKMGAAAGDCGQAANGHQRDRSDARDRRCAGPAPA